MSEALAVTSAIHLVLYRVPRDQLETILGHGFRRTLNVLKNFYGTRNAFSTSPVRLSTETGFLSHARNSHLALPPPHPLARNTPRNMESTKDISKRAAERAKRKLEKAKEKKNMPYHPKKKPQHPQILPPPASSPKDG